MAKLIYTAITSLDGYIDDETGKFDWAALDEEVHAFINDLARPVGTYLYGRRMYETMVGRETDPSLAARSPLMRDFAQIWRAADKIAYSTRLEMVITARTRIERDFDPDVVGQMKASAGRDLTVGGAALAAHAFKAGLVDECHLFVVPIVVGGGKRSLPDNVRVELELLDERRSAEGWITSATTPGRKGDGDAARNRGDVSPRPRVPVRRQRYRTRRPNNGPLPPSIRTYRHLVAVQPSAARRQPDS